MSVVAALPVYVEDGRAWGSRRHITKARLAGGVYLLPVRKKKINTSECSGEGWLSQATYSSSSLFYFSFGSVKCLEAVVYWTAQVS